MLAGTIPWVRTAFFSAKQVDALNDKNHLLSNENEEVKSQNDKLREEIRRLRQREKDKETPPQSSR